MGGDLGLTPEEDAELRRLHFMYLFGHVAERFSQRYAELRARDRRVRVRDPEDEVVVIPLPRELEVDEPVDD